MYLLGHVSALCLGLFTQPLGPVSGSDSLRTTAGSAYPYYSGFDISLYLGCLEISMYFSDFASILLFSFRKVERIE